MSLDISLDIEIDTGGPELVSHELYSDNMTHNVTPMWKAAGVYDVLYEWHGRKAGEAIETLKAGHDKMMMEPAVFTALNPENGWGSYPYAKDFLRKFLEACIAHPKATISIWR